MGNDAAARCVGKKAHRLRRTGSARTRRRGEELEHALCAAALTELCEVGYARLSMEGIAARARTGKAALYRRWPTKQALVGAALLDALPPLPAPRADRSPRHNLTTVFAAHCDVLSGTTGFPAMDIMGQLLHEPELRAIFAKQVIAGRLQLIETILRDAESRGEVLASPVTDLTARIGPALIMQHYMITGAPPSRRELARIVDTLLPNTSDER